MLIKMRKTATLHTLLPLISPGSTARKTDTDQIRLEIPAGPAGRYRLAQLDDYQRLPRRKFIWQAPVELSLTARASSSLIPGTWGFGFWNDPFSLALPDRARTLLLPTLPNTAWFFFAAPENYLSLRDDLPANGNLAAIFSSPHWPGFLSLATAPFLPLLLIHPMARWLRQLGSRVIKETSAPLSLEPEKPRRYRLNWETNQVRFWVDGELVHTSHATPQGPLGFVLWLDNQYAAWLPNGRLKYGTLENPRPAWIEIESLRINGQSTSIT